MTIYTTREYDGYGKQNYFWYEYRLEGRRVIKVRRHRQRAFDGQESAWHTGEREQTSWEIGDPDMPQWLLRYLPEH